MEALYHQGEIELQNRFGANQMAQMVGRVIKNTIVTGAIPFIENQVFVIVSSLDDTGDVWTSIIAGQKGWINAKEEGRIRFFLNKISSPSTDVFFNNIKKNSQMGMLFIELGTRRRYRVNGYAQLKETYLDLVIQEAYPNCPKYIQRRIPNPSQNENYASIISGSDLNEEQLSLISLADTFFVGSVSNNGYLDASHRGGNSGFIEIMQNGEFKIPDYAGNNMYNTLGNLRQIPKAGLLFLDFKNGSILQLSGTTRFLFDQFSDEDKKKTTETGRYWVFKTNSWLQTNHHHNIGWEFLDNSPFNPK